MINPLSEAYNWFLAFWNALPQPISAFIILAVSLFFVTALVNLIFR